MAAENADNRVQFEVAGEKYEYPDPFDLDLDEWVIIYDECGLILEDFAPFADDKKRERERIKRLRNPALMKALAIVGVHRSKPELDIDDVREMVGEERMLSLLESMAPEVADEDEVDPPTSELPSSENEQTPSSERKPDDSSGNTSPASPPSLDEPEEEPAHIGTGG